MHFPFANSVKQLTEFRKGSWTLWLDAEIAAQHDLIYAQLNDPALSGNEELKREKHKRVFRLNGSVIKWQRYRDPRRLIKANVFKNERLTRNEGGLLRTEWLNNLYLQEAGIEVPKPQGFAEQRIGGVIVVQAFITEYQPNILRLKDHIDADITLEAKERWLLKAIELAGQLHNNQVYHLDFHHRNILFSGEQRVLIDNEKVLHTAEPNRALHAAMLGRLGFGLRDNPKEQAAYAKMAVHHLHDTRDVFVAALKGKITGKVLDTLI